MLHKLKYVLGPNELSEVRKLLAGANLVDGKLSAGTLAAPVKHNQELARNDPSIEQLNALVMGNLIRHKKYLRAARPKSIAQPFYACYQQDMDYGAHCDDPIMGPVHQRYRSDLAITLFLSDPQEYEGGELVIQHTLGETSIKLPAGDAILYPATTLHRVNPVTSGQRWVAVTWVQSQVKDPEHRELLCELDAALESLLRKDAQAEHTRRIQHVYANLVRSWSDI